MNTNNELSVAELEALLAEKKQAEKSEKEQKRTAYENDRNDLVFWAVCEAVDMHYNIAAFKTQVMERLKQWLERMREYGGSKSKQENFEIMSADQSLKVRFTLHITKGFDERAKEAEAKMRRVLESYVKKKDLRQYKLLVSFMEKNSVTNEFDIRQISKFYQFENDFPDFPQYKEACDLFKESYVERKSKHYAQFFKRNDNGEWKAVVLDFAAL